MSCHFISAHFYKASLVLSMILLCTHAFSYTGLRSLRSSHPISPTIVSITPANSNVGDTVEISGTGFDVANILKNKISFVNSWYLVSGEYEYDSIQAEIIAVTGTTITAIVPEGATQGLIYVSVSDQDATSENNVYYNVVPTLESFFPDSGYIGDTIVITGTGFNAWHPSTNYLMFNGVSTTCIDATPTSIRTIVPFGTTTGPVMVFTNTPRVTSTSNFHVLPVMTAPFQEAGMINEEINIYGTGFDPSLASEYTLSFNGTPAVITLVAINAIRARVPKYATSGPMRLFFNNVEIKGSGIYFTVITKQPRVYSCTPAAGAVGSSVVVSGWDFDQGGLLKVSFGGHLAEIDSFTDNNIYTKVPLGAQTGIITVTAGGKTSDANLYFRVIETIFGMKPQVAEPGDTIVVTGNGFTYFNLDYYEVLIPHRSIPYTSIHPISITDTTFVFVVPASASASFNPLIVSDDNLSINVTLPRLSIMPVITRIEPDTVIAGRQTEIVIHGKAIKTLMKLTPEVVFPNDIVQRYIFNDTDTSFSARVPSAVADGIIPISVRVDDLLSVPVNLVVLPDTFPYTPLPPEFIYPSTVTKTAFRLQWSKCYRALGYLLDISTDNFETFLPGFKEFVLTDTTKMIEGLEPGTRYIFRVRPYSDTDTTAESSAAHGDVITVPLPPVALHAKNVSTAGFICRWNSTKGADLYEIHVSADLFANSISAYMPDTIAVLTITSNNPPAILQYRVRALNSWGESEYSNIITVALVTGFGDEPSIEVITLYPNPASRQVFISGLDEDALTETSMIDAVGKVSPIRLNYQGDGVFSYDIHTLPNGLYILKMIVHQKVIQLKFIKD